MRRALFWLVVWGNRACWQEVIVTGFCRGGHISSLSEQWMLILCWLLPYHWPSELYPSYPTVYFPFVPSLSRPWVWTELFFFFTITTGLFYCVESVLKASHHLVFLDYFVILVFKLISSFPKWACFFFVVFCSVDFQGKLSCWVH